MCYHAIVVWAGEKKLYTKVYKSVPSFSQSHGKTRIIMYTTHELRSLVCRMLQCNCFQPCLLPDLSEGVARPSGDKPFRIYALKAGKVCHLVHLRHRRSFWPMSSMFGQALQSRHSSHGSMGLSKNKAAKVVLSEFESIWSIKLSTLQMMPMEPVTHTRMNLSTSVSVVHFLASIRRSSCRCNET